MNTPVLLCRNSRTVNDSEEFSDLAFHSFLFTGTGFPASSIAT